MTYEFSSQLKKGKKKQTLIQCEFFLADVTGYFIQITIICKIISLLRCLIINFMAISNCQRLRTTETVLVF